jgi:hypothetical protein
MRRSLKTADCKKRRGGGTACRLGLLTHQVQYIILTPALYINFWEGWECFYDHIHIYTTRKILKLMIIYRTMLITELVMRVNPVGGLVSSDCSGGVSAVSACS